MTKNIIIEVIDVNAEIESSFSGSLSTGKLIDHFSSLTVPAECMDNYTTFCHADRGWKRKVDIGIGKSKAACGWQALAKWSSMVLLSELSLWSEEMPVKERNALVKFHWVQFKNSVAKKCFRNAIVFNNMASMRCKPTKESAGKSELPDLPEVSAEEIVETAKKEEKQEKHFSSMESIFSLIEKIKAQKKLAEIKTMIGELENLIKELES
jgi:hypothetical protein